MFSTLATSLLACEFSEDIDAVCCRSTCNAVKSLCFQFLNLRPFQNVCRMQAVSEIIYPTQSFKFHLPRILFPKTFLTLLPLS